MSKTLLPDQEVDCTLRPGMVRRGKFVRYIKPRVWPPKDDRQHCLVQFRHCKTATRLLSRQVRRAREPWEAL